MAKISPTSIKYMIHATFTVEGALDKPDVIGAIFGQTEGLLGSELEMRELQKEGKIGRIEVELEKKGKMTSGVIKIPTALDQSETTLIAAAIETIEKIGPSDSNVEVERIEDVRGSKRDYIIERAKKLMSEISSSTDSREISKEVKDHSRTSAVQEYGEEKLPYGDLSEKELIVVEGRADVLNLLRAGVNNVIAMNGTKLPNSIKELSKNKDITLFADGDRGGKLIARNLIENADVNHITFAPSGKEVEELTGKEILMCLRKKIPVEEYVKKNSLKNSGQESSRRPGPITSSKTSGITQKKEILKTTPDQKEKLKKIYNQIKGTGKAVFLDNELNSIKEVSSKAVSRVLKNTRKKPLAVVIDGTATQTSLKNAEKLGVKFIVAKNFTGTDTNINLLSFWRFYFLKLKSLKIYKWDTTFTFYYVNE